MSAAAPDPAPPAPEPPAPKPSASSASPPGPAAPDASAADSKQEHAARKRAARDPEPLGPVAPSTATREGPSLPSFLAHEGWLLLLSLVLAFMVWLVVRQMVDISRDVSLRVEYVAPADCQVFADDFIDMTLVGKQGEVEKVERELHSSGKKIHLLVGNLDAGRDERPIRHGDDTYRLPFPGRLLKDSARPPLPKGDVVRVRKERVIVEAPATSKPPRTWPEGVRVEVSLLTPSLEVLAPVGALNGPLTPDPIDLSPFPDATAGLAAPVEVTLSFEEWRRGPPGTKPDDPLVKRRAMAAISEGRASLRFVLWERAALTNAVFVICKRTHVVTEIRDAPGAAFTGERSPERPDQNVKANFTGEVRATKELLEQLRKSPDEWRWILRVREEDLPEGPEASKQVTGTLTLVAFGSLALPLAQAYIVFDPLAVQVEVRTVP